MNDLMEHHARVLDMAKQTVARVSNIHQEVDFHKRFDKNDTKDQYGEAIEWLHETGAWLFGPLQP